MEKRLIFLAMIFVFLCTLFSSCGENAIPEREMSLSKGKYFIWNDLYFYIGRTVMDDEDSTTMKYVNMKTKDTVGAPVYGNAFVEGGDPFNPKNLEFGSSLASLVNVMIDEEATAENDGIPVLLALLPFELPDDDTTYRRLVSYNMATGQMKVLCENIGEGAMSFGRYGDTIYYTQFIGEMDDFTPELTGETAFFRLPIEGGEPERIPLPEENVYLTMECSYKGKIYLESDDGECIYRYDLLKQSTERVCSFYTKNERKNEPLFYIDGYVYYKENQREVPKEGYDDELVVDLYRQPLDSLKDLTEENGELVLKDILFNCWNNGKKIYYTKAGDGNPFLTLQSDYSVLRWYDIETKETGIVFDYSDKQGILWIVSVISDDYMIISSFKEDFEDYWRECIFDRKTGERWELEDKQ